MCVVNAYRPSIMSHLRVMCNHVVYSRAVDVV